MDIFKVLLLIIGIFQCASTVTLGETDYSEYCTYCDEQVRNITKCSSDNSQHDSVRIDCSTSAQPCLLMLTKNSANDTEICISMEQSHINMDANGIKTMNVVEETKLSTETPALLTQNSAMNKQDTVQEDTYQKDNIKDLTVDITDAKVNTIEGDDEDRKKVIMSSNGKLEEQLTTIATTSMLNDSNVNEMNEKPAVDEEKMNGGMAAMDATQSSETAKLNDEKTTNTMDYVADEPQQEAASNDPAPSLAPATDKDNDNDNNAKATTITTVPPEAVTVVNHAVVTKYNPIGTPVRCYICKSTEDKNCKKKPTNFIDCNQSEGKDSGCFTLTKDNSTLIQRGCISNLSDDDMMYCKNNTHTCVMCNKELCNKLDAPSKAILNARIYWILMLLAFLPIIHGYGY